MVPASVWVEDEKQSPPVKDANLSRALVTLFFFLFFSFFPSDALEVGQHREEIVVARVVGH